MERCRKCDGRWRSGARVCPFCGVPLDSVPPPRKRVPPPILDPLLDLFEQSDTVYACPECGRQAKTKEGKCAPCATAWVRMDAQAHQDLLVSEPIREFAASAVARRKAFPKDLVRVFHSPDLATAVALIEEARKLRLKLWPGSDALDPRDEPGRVMLYAAGRDEQALRYLVDHYAPKADEDPIPRTPLEAALARARIWKEFGRAGQVLRELAPFAMEAEAQVLATEALAWAGRHREARARATSGLESATDRKARGRLLCARGLVSSLAPDCEAFGPGSDPVAAARDLDAAFRLLPRSLRTGKMLAETQAVVSDRHGLRETLRRLDRLSPNLLATDGPFRRLWEDVRMLDSR